MVRSIFALLVCACLLVFSGCIKPKITIFPDKTEPFEEYKLQGSGEAKILVISIKGFISDGARGWVFKQSGIVQEVVSQLKKAEKDKAVKAVVLKIDSAGGTVTGSDMLYHELIRFKESTGAKIVTIMMSLAASGGYYTALGSDFIMAHPTTVTGSIGVVFMRPDLTGLMGKIGLALEVDKSGKNKDMGSPFRPSTAEERDMMQQLISGMAAKFLDLTARTRNLGPDLMAQISTGRIFSADEALRLGLIDRIGYIDDAIQEAAKMAAIPDDSKVVVYRRTEIHNDNLYFPSATKQGVPEIHLLDFGIEQAIPQLESGFYYLWLPAGN